jgi:phage baseplate assembly protein W
MDRLGTDLTVLRDLAVDDAASIDLTSRANLVRPNTLRVLQTTFPRLAVYGAAPAELTDLATLSGRQNLAQALILRLLTPRGTLAALGHATYGSRLGELIGQGKSAATRALCRAYVLEVVAQEPRVERTAVALTFDADQETPSSFQLTLVVRPVAGGAPLGVDLEVSV